MIGVVVAIWRLFPLKVWAGIGVVAAIVALSVALKVSIDRTQRAEERARSEAAKSEALDRVAIQTTGIRSDQKEKEHEVETIPGADTRLPDGFGRDLQRVRDRSRHP